MYTSLRVPSIAVIVVKSDYPFSTTATSTADVIEKPFK